jgi:hypothetical protein
MLMTIASKHKTTPDPALDLPQKSKQIGNLMQAQGVC